MRNASRPRPSTNVTRRGVSTLLVTALAASLGAALLAAPSEAVTKTTRKAAKTTKAPATTAAPASTAAPTTTAAPAATATATKPTGTLRIGTFGDLVTFDPARGQVLTQTAYYAIPYDSLLRRDAKGNVVAGLVTKWERPDSTTWRLTLRADVKFHDGETFDAAALKANIERSKSVAGNPSAGLFARIVSATPTADGKLDVKFSRPNPSFPTEMTNLAFAPISPKVLGGDVRRNPVGTGGWIFDAKATQEGVKYVFTANPNYWDKANQGVERIEVSALPDNNARFNALRTGQIDMMDALLASQINEAKSAGLQSTASDGQLIQFFVGDRNGTLVPALAKTEVRQAMQFGIDRASYVKAILEGNGDASAGLWAPSSTWYNPQNAQLYKYNPDKAKDLLRKAGYPNGFEMSIPSFATTRLANEAFAQMMGSIGIKVNIVQVQPGTAGAEFRARKFPVVYAPISVDDPNTFWGQWLARDSGWNPFGADTSVIDALNARGESLDSDAARKAVYSDLEQAVLDDGDSLVVAHTSRLAAYSSKVKGDPFIYRGDLFVRPQGIRLG